MDSPRGKTTKQNDEGLWAHTSFSNAPSLAWPTDSTTAALQEDDPTASLRHPPHIGTRTVRRAVSVGNGRVLSWADRGGHRNRYDSSWLTLPGSEPEVVR